MSRTYRTAIEHFENIHASQVENVAHANLGGDGIQAYFHALERRPFGFGAQILQIEPVLLPSLRRYHQSLRARILQDVAPCLVKKLIGEADVACVEDVNNREICEVWYPFLEQVPMVEGMIPSKHDAMLSSGRVRGKETVIVVIRRPARASGQRSVGG